MNTIIKLHCPFCKKAVTEESHVVVGKRRYIRLSCKHTMNVAQTTLEDLGEDLDSDLSPLDSFISSDGRKLYDFQKLGVEFAVKSNVRCLIADEMGLGKTVQALATLKASDTFPALIICKSGLKLQWSHEIYRWLGKDCLNQVIDSNRETPYFGAFKITIVSFDMLRRLKWTEDEDIIGQFKTIVIDETQQIKNPESIRTKAVRKLSKKVEHIIGLSGTPIKNNAGEYFSILNILQPGKFPQYSSFKWEFVDTYMTGNGMYERLAGLKNPERFKSMTKDFIIRRERDEVLPDLPKINRTFSFAELGQAVEAAYVQQLELFNQAYEDETLTGFARATNLLQYLSRMRHLTGLAKIDSCTEYIEEFLLSTNRKIVIFLHHKDVHQLLYNKVAEICRDGNFAVPLNLTSDLGGEGRQQVIEDFKLPENRILIASTLASGEGLNLQFCSDCVMLERQWNPANEEQAEARFIRIGSTASQVNANYVVAVGTIDEFFSELVERKRVYVFETLKGEESATNWDESSIMKELQDILYTKGLKKWRAV